MTTELVAERPPNALERYWHMREKKTTPWREFLAGSTTFASMSYIVPLNAIILTSAPVTGYLPAFTAIATMTAFSAFILTGMMGLIGRVPIGLAAGLGINGVITFQVAPVVGFRGAMIIVMLEGLLTLLLVATGLREKIFDAIPKVLKYAIAAAIGAFLFFIGLVDGGMVAGNSGVPPVVQQPIVTFPRIIFVLTLVIAFVFYIKKVKAGIILSIIIGTVLSFVGEAFLKLGPAVVTPGGWALNVPNFEGKGPLFGPDFSIFTALDPVGDFVNLLATPWHVWVFYILSLAVVDLFDTTGTIVAVGKEAKFLDENDKPKHIGRILFVDSFAAFFGGFTQTSSNTSYIESVTGAEAGARTGFASIVTGGWFFVAMLISPLAQLVPSEAAAPILVLVGGIMVTGFIGSIIDDVVDMVKATVAETRTRVENEQLSGLAALDVFLRVFLSKLAVFKDDMLVWAFSGAGTILMMPFTYGIASGIGFGFIFHALGMLIAGKGRQVPKALYVLAVVFVVYYAMPAIVPWVESWYS